MSSQGDSQPSQDSTVTLMDEERHEVIYFAYGSNLSTEQMLRRCPSSVPIGLGYLAGWRWIINARGYANIVPAAADDDERNGDRVYGLLYLLPPDDEAALDGYEGVPYAYKKYKIDLLRVKDDVGQDVADEQRLTALVYVDDERTVADVPRGEYVGRMEAGLEEAVEDWGMPAGYAEELRGWLRGETQP